MALLDRLVDAAQRQKAILQDRAVEMVFSATSDAVLHGGTAIWRCYSGERFSKDLDFYFKKDSALQKALNRLAQGGLRRELLQTRKANFGLYRNYILRSGNIDIALQVTLNKIKGDLTRYETSNGAYRNINSLSAERLLLEKADALSDRHKARDLYDIWILKNYDFSQKTAEILSGALTKHPKIIDFDELKHTVYGMLPPIDAMKDDISRRLDEIRS
jgi:predicted nucleotidyltransferase component of viral defense system